jgi:Fe-S-cluster containining protein
VHPASACLEAGGVPCIALQEDQRDGIYELRPSVCHEFPEFMPDRPLNPECLRLHERLGMTALSTD